MHTLKKCLLYRGMFLLLLKVCPECKLLLFKDTICISRFFFLKCPKNNDLVRIVWGSTVCRISKGRWWRGWSPSLNCSMATWQRKGQPCWRSSALFHTHLVALLMHSRECRTDFVRLWEDTVLAQTDLALISLFPTFMNVQLLMKTNFFQIKPLTSLQVRKIWWTFSNTKL